ncbi:MAG: HAD family phosphatase [Nitrospirota bacterium]|nr:HAD family phosphatase [Nitrospirota bacterium]
MLRAIIFDFDGVIADSEPIHFAVFQRVLGEKGFFLSQEEYYADYLGYDDKGCFAAFLALHGHPVTQETIDELVGRKAAAYFDYIKEHPVIFPGVCELIHEVAMSHPLAVCSGALRHEIEFILEQAGIRKAFAHITSAEDVIHGKPNPEGFLHALAALNQHGADRFMTPDECLVIEDSLPGIRGAHAAGMKVLAVANTHRVEDLQEADAVTSSLADVKFPELLRRLWG